MSPTDPESLVGQIIEAYRLDALLGMGGMGAVFLASNKQGQQVAVKILVPPMLVNAVQREEFRKRFLLEAQTLSRLRHPHILPVSSYGVAEPNGFVYMLMPYMHGGTLAQRLNPSGLPFPLVLTYVQQVAAALDYAHEQNVIHRDLKPANVLLDKHDQLFLADFGIAKVFNMSMTTLTNVNQAVGTPGYMAPEQITNEQIGPATDVYGLATLTYILTTGRLPFDVSSLLAALQQIMLTEPPDPCSFRPDLPVDAARALLCGLAKSPQARFQRAGAFVHAFAHGLQGSGSLSPELATALSEEHILTQISCQEEFILTVKTPPAFAPSSYATMPVPLTNSQAVLPGAGLPSDQADGLALNQPAASSNSLSPATPLLSPSFQSLSFSSGSDLVPSPPPLILPAPASSPDFVRSAPPTPIYQMHPHTIMPARPGFVPQQHRSSRSLWISLLLTLLLLIALPALYFFIIVHPASSRAQDHNPPVSSSSPPVTTHASTVPPTLQHTPVATATSQPLTTATSPSVAPVSTTPVAPASTIPVVVASTTPVVTQRPLSVTATQSNTVNATGQGTVAATYATGSISIVNYGASGDPLPLSLPVGTVISNTDGCGASSIQVVLDNAVNLPANTGASTPAMVAQAHTVLTGNVANFAAKCGSNYTFAHCSPTCLSPSALVWEATNVGPFAGADDASTYPIVQQSDIDAASVSLKAATTHSASTNLRGLLHSDEHLLADPQCNSNVTSNHAAGEHVANVVVTVSTTCRATAST